MTKHKMKTMESFYNKENASNAPGDELDDEIADWLAAQTDKKNDDLRQPSLKKVPRVNSEDINVLTVERDPGLRCQIWDFLLVIGIRLSEHI